jgi:hypothetical protein
MYRRNRRDLESEAEELSDRARSFDRADIKRSAWNDAIREVNLEARGREFVYAARKRAMDSPRTAWNRSPLPHQDEFLPNYGGEDDIELFGYDPWAD